MINFDAGITDDIERCYDATVKLGFDTFLISGQLDDATKAVCRTSEFADKTHKAYGKATTSCKANGHGKDLNAQVYKINRKLKNKENLLQFYCLEL